MNGYVKKVYEFSDNNVNLEECWKYSVEIDKENDAVTIYSFEIENNELTLQDTMYIECAELVFKTIAKEFDI